MKIEHFGYMVKNPAEVADWYVKNLGFSIVRRLDNGADAHFLADDTGAVMIEIYNNTDIPVPDYASMNPLLFHLAMVVTGDDMATERQRLLDAGATIAIDTFFSPDDDELTMLRDPWGMAVQLCKRVDPMV